jgi:hypothetical protein
MAKWYMVSFTLKEVTSRSLSSPKIKTLLVSVLIMETVWKDSALMSLFRKDLG